jgi:RHH-type proline utilization regulon transcriptional repressor/proline dehydrogenase/delta 1-pyrroline-5-carboxylate dehydrogenase
MTHPAPFAAFAPPVRQPTPLRRAITEAYRRSEPECLAPLLEQATLTPDVQDQSAATARALVTALRAKPKGGAVEGLVREFSLSSQEGVALMCLAEALLRIPDTATRDALIRDKIANGDWAAHLGGDGSLFVHAATWGLVVTGKLLESVDDRGFAAALTRLIARTGEPVIRRAVDLAMRMMGEQFVTGETIAQALDRRARWSQGLHLQLRHAGRGGDHGGGCRPLQQGLRTGDPCHRQGQRRAGIYAGPGISIKLSALHPRYSRAQADRVMGELLLA